MNDAHPIRLSVLDLAPVASGSTTTQALRNTLDLAQLADRLGYTRYWLAEHHNSHFIASASPEILIGHVASVTSRIRVGSGGIMLPNHAPLKVAEMFRTLEALHPGRIDLGIGRAPGTDPLTAVALRRSREALVADDMSQQMDELLGFLSDSLPPDHPFRTIVAMPTGVAMPEIWLLGSSDYSARLAARLGLGFAFAHHISPEPAIEALWLYHANFRPSSYLSAPRAMLGVSVICAETDARAEELAGPIDLALLRLAQRRMAPLASVEEAAAYPYSDAERAAIRANRSRLFVGSPTSVQSRLMRLAEQTGVSELMITTNVHDHQDRRRSYELLAEAFALTASAEETTELPATEG